MRERGPGDFRSVKGRMIWAAEMHLPRSLPEGGECGKRSGVNEPLCEKGALNEREAANIEATTRITQAVTIIRRWVSWFARSDGSRRLARKNRGGKESERG